jgi:glycosyltransferase involved in cell wall biosynthesis
LVKTLREIDPDVVHAHLHTGQYPGRVAALIAGARSIVLTIHGREPGGPIRWVLDRYLHARTTRFIVFTEGQRLRLARAERIAPERIVVIPNGVSATPLRIREDVRRELGLPNNAFVVYSAARLAEQKNHAALLDAMALLEQEGLRDIHLVLAGAGPLDNTLRGRAAQLGLTQRVVFLGFRSDASALCPGMDIFALPSHWEGMPLALGEAMIAGLAPLVTPWQDHGDFVTDGRTGYVSRGFDGPALAAAIRRAWSSGATRDAIAREARRAARAMFDGAATVRAHAALYRELSQIGGAAS